MRLLERRPARVFFKCDCRSGLDFLALDQVGERIQIPCSRCDRVWEQLLLADERGRGWSRSLVKGPSRKTLSQPEKRRPVSRASVFVRLVVVGLLGLAASRAHAAQAGPPARTIASRTAQVDGFQFHYLTAGQGPAVVLLHGYAETSRMWRPIIPLLAERFTVIAPDLPGIGDSAIPTGGLDMKAAAVRVHALARSLGVERAEVVGHDIGLMVAYAYAAQYPSEVTKLVLMDAFLPGVPGWEAIYDNPGIWHFRFNGPTPEKLVEGRERTYFSYFWNDLAADRNHSLPKADRDAYISSYSRPGRMKAGWAYFVSFPKAAKDFTELSKVKLQMPVLSIGGEKSLGKELGEQAKLVGTDVTVIVLKDAGHWILEEKPAETTAALVKFL